MSPTSYQTAPPRGESYTLARCATSYCRTLWRCEASAFVLSQQCDVAEGSLIPGVRVRVGSSPDNGETDRHHRTVRARLARRKGATKVNQWLNPLKRVRRLQPGGYGPDCNARRPPWLRAATPKPSLAVGGEATRNVCGVLVAMLQGHSWAPTPSSGPVVNVGTVSWSPSPSQFAAAGRHAVC